MQIKSFIRYVKIFIISLIKVISLGLIYTIEPYIRKFQINNTLTMYIDKFNYLLISLLIIKFYIGFSDYKKIFKLLENLYSSTKYLFTLYITSIDYNYISDNEESYDESIDFHDIQHHKKIHIMYIKEILIMYISFTLSYIFKLNNKLHIFTEYKQLHQYLYNEIEKIRPYDYIDSTSSYCTLKKTHITKDTITPSFIELLVLKNFNSIKNMNYINQQNQDNLVKNFKKIQDIINELYIMNLRLNDNNIYYPIIIFTYIIIYVNIISIYLQYLNDNVYNFLITLFLNFIIIFIDDIINQYLNMCYLLANIFNFDNYIKEINDDMYLINYLYASNTEYAF
jgi:hypothetical protein